ncbi:hypothetical protein PC115_g22141 [Phytophthora cactorum]|uniref:Uncharacterized protein n=1 Tax=Phytophthora cactorum TaxID=29920 RepID=A0A8T1AL16_9STRA|nr:hypothetical protein PC115_g22141 [Phytophthora cactorum]KAG3142770.1 hypothetical protein C6341_g19320 [Phytophthora cactorum]
MLNITRPKMNNTTAEGMYARSDNRQPRGNIPDRERGFNQDRRGGERGSIKTTEVVTKASVKTLVVDVTSTATTGAYSMDLVQSAAHDAGQCELFRNFQDLAKFVRIKGTKEERPPELKYVVQERHLN